MPRGEARYHVVRPGWFTMHVAFIDGRSIGWEREADAVRAGKADGWSTAYVEVCRCGEGS